MNPFRAARVLLSACLLGTMILFGASWGGGQEKKDGKKSLPAIKLVLPLAIKAGTTVTATIRGHRLGDAKEVRFPGGQASVVKIVSKGAAAVPDKNPEKVGDTQVVVELKANGALPVEPVPVVVVTPDGESPPYSILVADPAFPVIVEKEPNDGFRQAQEVPIPCAIEGTIDRQRDVDVFKFVGKKGQKIVAEIVAARQGSALDGMLTLYDAAGNQLAFNDRAVGADPRLESALPADGVYFLSLIDAHDLGSNLHAYRLLLRSP